MNKFEEVVVRDISAIKTETKSCQKACLERHQNLDGRMDDMDERHTELQKQLFDPVTGVITIMKIDGVRLGIIATIASFIGSTVGVLALGYVFSRVVH